MKDNKTKKCSWCKKIKIVNDFCKHIGMKDGLYQYCRKCQRENSIRKYRTKEGLVSMIYKRQKDNSKKRGHNMPSYSKEEFAEWIISKEKFHKLYDIWKNSGFKKDFAPSVDRKKDSIGYTMENIQIMTWRENYIKKSKQIERGESKSVIPRKAVCQYTKDGKFISEYISIGEAGKITKIKRNGISLCCRGKRKTASGFKWEYKEKEKA